MLCWSYSSEPTKTNYGDQNNIFKYVLLEAQVFEDVSIAVITYKSKLLQC